MRTTVLVLLLHPWVDHNSVSMKASAEPVKSLVESLVVGHRSR